MKHDERMAALKKTVEFLAREVAKSDDVDRLQTAGMGLDEAMREIERRITWLDQFGTLIELCGMPDEASGAVDLPISGTGIHFLLQGGEQAMPDTGVLENSPVTLTYLLLKSASLRGRFDQLQRLEALYGRWASGLQSTKAEEGRALLHAHAPIQPEHILLAWLQKWGFKGCELVVLEALERTLPYLEGNQPERLAALRGEFPERVLVPSRDVPYYPLRIQTNISPEQLQKEVAADLAAKQSLPVSLLRQHEANERQVSYRIPADWSNKRLFEALTGCLVEKLGSTAQEIRTLAVRMRMDSTSFLQPEETWLNITTARAAELGLTGSSIWIAPKIRDANKARELAWDIYLGVDPAGLCLKAFLDLAAVVSDKRERNLPVLAREAHDSIKSFMEEQVKAIGRSEMISELKPQDGSGRLV